MSWNDTEMTAAKAALPVTASASLPAAFPAAMVEACLRAELIETVKAEASIKGVALPAAPAQIATMPIHIDSLVTVSILCAIEPIVGFELSEDVVRAGGYGSVEGALEQLLPRIEEQWTKRKGGKL